MNSKPLIWLCMGIGSFIGGYIPLLWGSSIFSFSSVLFGAIGAGLGVYAGFKLSE